MRLFNILPSFADGELCRSTKHRWAIGYVSIAGVTHWRPDNGYMDFGHERICLSCGLHEIREWVKIPPPIDPAIIRAQCEAQMAMIQAAVYVPPTASSWLDALLGGGGIF